jgi:hypothetical protein
LTSLLDPIPNGETLYGISLAKGFASSKNVAVAVLEGEKSDAAWSQELEGGPAGAARFFHSQATAQPREEKGGSNSLRAGRSQAGGGERDGRTSNAM